MVDFQLHGLLSKILNQQNYNKYLHDTIYGTIFDKYFI